MSYVASTSAITVSSDANTSKAREKFISVAEILPQYSSLATNLHIQSQVSISPSQDGPANTFSLQNFISSMYAAILEDSILQIRMLEECNNELRLYKALADVVHLRAIKYKITQPAVIDPIDAIDPKNLDKEEYKLDKLAKDRKYLHEALFATYLDLSLEKSFKALVKRLTDVADQEKFHELLMEEESKNTSTRRELARQLRLQRNHIKSVNYATELAVEKLKSQVEDSALQTEISNRYITKWQVARTEQNNKSIKFKEWGPIKNIDYYKKRADHENRAHSEVELLMNIAINEQLDKVESWMEKYDKDMEKIDLKIQIMKNDYTNAYEKRMHLEDKLAKHDKLMKDWKFFKDERGRARLHHEMINNAATVVQAWWRGLLVRLELGPYKPTKKPAPSNKK